MQSHPSLRRLASPLLAVVALACSASACANAWVNLFDDGSASASDPVSVSLSKTGIPTSSVSHAFGSANLATGTIGSSVDGTVIGTYFADYLATSTAEVTDALTFHGPGSSVPISLSLHVDGSFVMSGTGAGISAQAFAFIGLGNDSANLSLIRVYNPGINLDVLNSSLNGSAGSYLNKTLDSAEGLVVLSVLAPTNTPLNFTSYMQLANSPGGPATYSSADFSHTAQIALSMPDGYSVTSASGQFLSAPPVPEPASGALIVAGLATLGFVIRRRQVLKVG